MSKITLYPLDGIEYDAADAAGYNATRASGVYSSEDDFTVTAAGGYDVTVSEGLAWIQPERFSGLSVVKRNADTLTLPIADGRLPRIDRIVLRYDAAARSGELLVLQGTPAAEPAPPAISRTNLIYDLCLAEVSRPAGSLAVTAGDITDTRLDESLCGVMRDAVTRIPTDSLLNAAKTRINALEETASASASAAKQSEANSASSAAAAKESQNAAATSEKNAADSKAAAEQALADTQQAKTDALTDISAAHGTALSDISTARSTALTNLSIAEETALSNVADATKTSTANAATAAQKAADAAQSAADALAHQQAAATSEGNAASSAAAAKASEERAAELTSERVAWDNISGKPSTYPPSSHKHTKAEITDFPSSMPASDVPAWAKAKTKPSYAWGEITGKPSAFTPASHTHDLSALINALSTGTSTPVDADYYVSQYVGGGTNTTTYHRRPMSALWAYIKGKADSLYQAKGSYAAANHSHSYLPLSGGTMTGDVVFSAIGDTATSKRIHWSGSTDAAAIYYQTTAADQGNLVINLMDDSNCYLRIASNGSFKSYFSPADGNFHGNVNGTADTATKLGTSAGSATQPVYFSGGKPVACSYTLGKSVPSNAVFTDTNTWRGVQNNLTSTATDQSLSAAMGKWLNENKAASSHTHSAGTTGSFSGVQASGSNYVRFTDGTQICWGSISTKTFTVKGTYYNDADGYTDACTATSRNTRPAAEFPQAFANTSYSIALNLSYSVLSDNNTFKGSSGALYGSSYLQTVTSVSPALGKQTTHCVFAVGAWGFYIAVGRWK